jgi:hypothetical protein
VVEAKIICKNFISLRFASQGHLHGLRKYSVTEYLRTELNFSSVRVLISETRNFF